MPNSAVPVAAVPGTPPAPPAAPAATLVFCVSGVAAVHNKASSLGPQATLFKVRSGIAAHPQPCQEWEEGAGLTRAFSIWN